MKKIVIILIILLIPLSLTTRCYASTYSDALEEIGGGTLTDSLDDKSKEILKDFGVDEKDYNSIINMSFSNVFHKIFDIVNDEGVTPFSSSALILSLLLIYSVFDNFRDGLKNKELKCITDTVFVLVVTLSISSPVISVINRAIESINNAGSFMLLYIPIMAVILITNGQSITGASYYSLVVMVGEGVTYIAKNIVSPLLSVFLGLSVTSAISFDLNMQGIINEISKIIKWIIGFAMTVFSGLLTFKTLITTSADSISTRAVRFTLSSFIPIVGSALSEAYKTIQGSMCLLKTGLGVFVIISVMIVFLPIIIHCLLWIISLNITGGIGNMLGIKGPISIIKSCSTVLTTLLVIILCVMAIYVISTAIILTMGNGTWT